MHRRDWFKVGAGAAGLPLMQAMAQGQMPEEGAAETYEKAMREFELSPTGQAYIVARSNFEKVMAKVNEEMAKGIEKGATSNIITLG